MERVAIIRNQINRMTFWAMGAIGKEAQFAGADNDHECYLQFKVNMQKPCGWLYKIKVHLTPLDVYRVELWKIRGTRFEMVSQIDNVYCDVLDNVVLGVYEAERAKLHKAA